LFFGFVYRIQGCSNDSANRKTRTPYAVNYYQNKKQRINNMQTIVLIILIGLAGGVAVGIQSPLASMISQRLGVMESVFIVHIGGAVAALIPLLMVGGGKLGNWRSIPWYTLGAGIFGLVVIGAVSYMIPRVGVAASITTIIAGQLLVGTILDHFGLLGAVERSLDPTRIVGLAVVLAGVWLTVK
jgi:bacterial/archaeal transporter family-2 protein